MFIFSIVFFALALLLLLFSVISGGNNQIASGLSLLFAFVSAVVEVVNLLADHSKSRQSNDNNSHDNVYVFSNSSVQINPGPNRQLSDSLGLIVLVVDIILAVIICSSVLGAVPLPPKNTDPKETIFVTDLPTPLPTPSPNLSPTPSPIPAPTEDPFGAYYDELANKIAAYSSKIAIPSKDATYSEDETYKRYAQGTYGQGVSLLNTYGGARIGLIDEGAEMTVLAMQEGCAFVQLEDGRFGWVAAAKIASSFDADLSHQRKVNYVINDSNYWTKDGWREWILANASDFPDYVVEAARNG